jgi:hypothetical protein
VLRPRGQSSLLIAVLLTAAGSTPAAAQTSDPTDAPPADRGISLPSRVSFQSDAYRHRIDGALPASMTPKDEPRTLWLARLAAEGRRPVRLPWAPRDETAVATPDPFARLSLDVKGTPTLLPLYVAEPERWARVMESLLAASTCPCTSWGSIPGRVPDGDTFLGSLLRAGKSGTDIVLSWGASCSGSANDYTVHKGTLGTWYSHQAVVCSTGGVTSTILAPGAGSSYFLVVPVTDDAEGSYGTNSAGQQRPNSSVSCRAAWVTQQCP